MSSPISLANKCQLLFGAAVVLILAAALGVPWVRTDLLVRDYQVEVARQTAEAWLAGWIQLGPGALPPTLETLAESEPDGGTGDALPTLRLAFVRVEDIDTNGDPSLAEAMDLFRESPKRTEHFGAVEVGDRSWFRYTRAVRESQWRALRDPALAPFATSAFEPEVADPLRAILVVDRISHFAEGQLLVSRVYIIAAGLVGSLLAILAFYLILTRLILRPVRKLRHTTERVQAGNLAIRSEIHTGDEFEQLSEAFNAMLDRMAQSQAQLSALNESLDLKVNELAQANVGLFESNRLKSEFLANVSHELRTPLNSIIGFTELLAEMAGRDPHSDPKRRRYLDNILSSGKALLEMINDLLDLAKIEAGRMELAIEQTSVGDLIEGLVGIMGPQAESKSITLRSQVAANVPVIDTDPGKLQQILYNFLSNAIKFTPEGGTVTISADRVSRQGAQPGVRAAVSDTGPGIPEDLQDVIFEKFRQGDGGHTRQHSGTGLGLAICRELAQMLGANIAFVSKAGAGTTFYVDLPLTQQPERPRPLMGAMV
jgi:signal transduction histidine kinase